MSKLKAFFKAEAKPKKAITVKLERFNEAVEITPLSPSMNERIMDKSMKNTINAKGKPEQVFSGGRYMKHAAIALLPWLEDKDLQESYGVIGAEALLDEMFTADEVSAIVAAGTGDAKIDVNELTDEAKN